MFYLDELCEFCKGVLFSFLSPYEVEGKKFCCKECGDDYFECIKNKQFKYAVERKCEGVKTLKKYDIGEWLADFAIDNELRDGDEILITLDGREICIVSPKFDIEEVEFKVIKSRC